MVKLNASLAAMTLILWCGHAHAACLPRAAPANMSQLVRRSDIVVTARAFTILDGHGNAVTRLETVRMVKGTFRRRFILSSPTPEEVDTFRSIHLDVPDGKLVTVGLMIENGAYFMQDCNPVLAN